MPNDALSAPLRANLALETTDTPFINSLSITDQTSTYIGQSDASNIANATVLEAERLIASEAIAPIPASAPSRDITGNTNPVYRYDNKDYLLTSGLKTWSAAQAEAEALGGNLVAINDAAEEAWLQEVFGQQGLWIGISDRAQEGSFTWASGEAVTYTNWAPGEPNDQQGNQDYGWMNFGATQQWDDNHASTIMPGIIEIQRPATTVTNPGNISIKNSNIRIDEDNDSVEITVLRSQGTEGTLTVDYRTIAGTATLDADYQPQTGTLTFAPGETEKSAFIPLLADSLIEGEEQFAFAIDNVTGGGTLLAPRTAQITLLDNDTPVIYEFRGNTYRLTNSAKNWGQSQAQALQLGGNLVTLNSVEEEQWIKQTFGDSEDFWIGLNDQQREGSFEWASGQQLTYTNWTPGEPNNQQGNQDYARMNFGKGLGNGQWDDSFATAAYRGIIEIGGDNTPPQPISDTPPDVAPTATTVIDGLNLPTAIEWTPDGDKMFIAEKNGVVRVYENNQILDSPFIDISPQVNEIRGLLDIAIHPDFDNNPYVYLLYAYDPPDTFAFDGLAGPDGSGNRAARLTRVTADAATNFRTAVPGSEVILLGKNSTWKNFNAFVDSTIDLDEPPAGILPDGTNLQDFLNADSESHTIGSVEFGLDGSLFVSNGDGTSYNQLDARTTRVQDIDNLSGKILRVDPLTGEGLTDNPFYNGDPDANRSKVYQLGLRNPFRFSIHPETGAPVIGDVGWTNWEEVNIGEAGANFGWPYYEGGNGVSIQTTEYQALPEAQAFYNSNAPVTASFLGLNHASDGIDAIVMGDVYDGDAYPDQYRGDIFLNHLGRGLVRNISLDSNGNITDVGTFATGANLVVQIKTGPDGTLYFVDLDDGTVGRWTFD